MDDISRVSDASERVTPHILSRDGLMYERAAGQHQSIGIYRLISRDTFDVLLRNRVARLGILHYRQLKKETQPL